KLLGEPVLLAGLGVALEIEQRQPSLVVALRIEMIGRGRRPEAAERLLVLALGAVLPPFLVEGLRRPEREPVALEDELDPPLHAVEDLVQLIALPLDVADDAVERLAGAHKLRLAAIAPGLLVLPSRFEAAGELFRGVGGLGGL